MSSPLTTESDVATPNPAVEFWVERIRVWKTDRAELSTQVRDAIKAAASKPDLHWGERRDRRPQPIKVEDLAFTLFAIAASSERMITKRVYRRQRWVFVEVPTTGLSYRNLDHAFAAILGKSCHRSKIAKLFKLLLELKLIRKRKNHRVDVHGRVYELLGYGAVSTRRLEESRIRPLGFQNILQDGCEVGEARGILRLRGLMHTGDHLDDSTFQAIAELVQPDDLWVGIHADFEKSSYIERMVLPISWLVRSARSLQIINLRLISHIASDGFGLAELLFRVEGLPNEFCAVAKHPRIIQSLCSILPTLESHGCSVIRHKGRFDDTLIDNSLEFDAKEEELDAGDGIDLDGIFTDVERFQPLDPAVSYSHGFLDVEDSAVEVAEVTKSVCQEDGQLQAPYSLGGIEVHCGNCLSARFYRDGKRYEIEFSVHAKSRG